MYLAENIRYLRIKKGYSQDFVAEKLGYKSFTTIQKWESGISEPPVKKLKELSDLLGVDMDDLNNKKLAINEKIEEPTLLTFGQRIKQRRLELNLTVDELANKLKKNRATIYRYEKDDIKDMPTTFLEPLANALETTPAYLMGWNDPALHNIFVKKTINSSHINTIKVSSKEESIINKYRAIDNDGKKVVDTVLDREYERATLPMLKAAHERTDIEVTDEMKQHDEDIMNDENF